MERSNNLNGTVEIARADAGRRAAGRFTGERSGLPGGMFAFFSSRLGCLGSLLVSVIGTVLLYLLFRAL